MASILCLRNNIACTIIGQRHVVDTHPGGSCCCLLKTNLHRIIRYNCPYLIEGWDCCGQICLVFVSKYVLAFVRISQCVYESSYLQFIRTIRNVANGLIHLIGLGGTIPVLIEIACEISSLIISCLIVLVTTCAIPSTDITIKCAINNEIS